MLRKEYDELWAKINETEVEKWAKLVDAECEFLVPFGILELAKTKTHSNSEICQTG